jgi:hypothetical protein
MLVVKLGKQKVFFRLSPEAFAGFRAWVGPPTPEDLKLGLKRRLSWVMPLGVLFVLTSLPIGNLPLNPVSLGLGLALVVTGTLAKLWPHRIMFALDALWFSFLAFHTHSICATFSSSVMRARRSSTRRAVASAGFW